MISTLFTLLGFGSTEEQEIDDSEAVVTEFYEVTHGPQESHSTVGVLREINRIATEGMFHTYSEAQLVFDLGEYGDYYVDLDLPRYPEDDSELEEFLDNLGYEVSDLPSLEGNLELDFVRIDGEWELL